MKDRHRDIFGQARVEARLDMLSDAKDKPIQPTTQELDAAAKLAEQSAIEQVGEDSEKRFSAYAKHLEIVKSVRNANPLDDVYRGIDKWILFREDQGLPELPVQVKSSYRDARLYKHGDPNTGRKPDPCFTRLHETEIVINCGRAVKPKAFRRQMMDEVRRIKLALNADPTLTKYIKD